MRKYRIIGYLLFLAVVMSFLPGCWDSGKSGEFILLHTNDSHGSVLPTDGVGGMAERATFIRSVREKNPDVLLLDAGDFNTGQAVSNLFDARPDVEAYNYMGYDAITLGNHEFDKPLPVLQQQMKWAEFPFVVSNVFSEGVALGEPYLIREIGNVRVGIFGLTTKNTKNISVYAQRVDFENEIETARKMVETLKGKQVDVIIGLVHLGFVESTPGFVTSTLLAEQVEGIDILVDGHSHSYIEQPVKVGKTWIVTANQSGNYVGEGKVIFRNGRLKELDWRPVKMEGFVPDTVLLSRLQGYVEAAQEDLQTVIGHAAEEFVLFQDGENVARYRETALGDLVADALKWKAGRLQMKVDFGLTNSGGIRAALPAGELTKGDVLGVLPFNNVLEVIALKGKDVRKLFGFIAAVPEGNGAFAQVSQEVKVVYNRKAKQLEFLSIHGQPVEDEKMYYMATCDYVAAGKDGYDAGLGEVLSRENTSLLLSQVLIDYLGFRKDIVPVTDGRIQIK